LNRYYDYLNIRAIYKLGAAHQANDFRLYFVFSYIKLINSFFGLQQRDVSITKKLIDSDGKIIIDDFKYFFDLMGHMNLASQLTSSWDFSYHQYNYLLNDKYVSLALYNYTSLGYFYSGRVNYAKFMKRKRNRFVNFSNFAVCDLLNTLLRNRIVLARPVRKYSPDSLLHDVFFEGQDFKHSLLFEAV